MKNSRKIIIKLPIIIASILSFTTWANTIAITGTTIHTASDKGVIKNATLLIKDNKIVNLGSDISIPDSAHIIDASGKHITPGLIYPASQLGLFELPGNATADVQSAKGSDLNAAYRIDYAFNHNAIAIAENRRHGITRALTIPTSSGKLFHGSGVVIKLDGSLNSIVTPSAMSASFSSISNRNVAWERLYRILDETLYFKKHQQSIRKGKDTSTFTLSAINMRALFPVMSGHKPLILELNSELNLLQAIKFQKKYQLDLIIKGAAEGWKVANQLAESNIPVIINPQENRPTSFNKLGATYTNADKLDQAGVLFAFMYENSNQRAFLVRQAAGIAVAHGLSRQSALKAITANPAKILKLRKVGSLVRGNIADFVIWDGDPLEVTTNADAVFIEGKSFKLESRRTQLRDKYLALTKP